MSDTVSKTIPPRVQDLTGQVFGRLMVVDFVGVKKFPSGSSTAMWRCECECGNESTCTANNLKTGHTKSCGCFEIENRKTMRITHGDSGKRMWVIWRGMIQRCTDPNSISFKYYGAKGIKIEWSSYEEFRRDMGPTYADGFTIGRKNSNKNYCKENCQWETPMEQNRNYSRNVFLTFSGKTMVKTDWALEMGIKPATLSMRLKLGWSVEKALTTPVKTPKRAL